MRYRLILTATLAAALAACASNNNSGSASSGSNDASVPQAVEAAFYSEHPHDHIDSPTTRHSENGYDTYEVPYTRADGTKGLATYGEMGELLNNQ
jgi:hypothetical protein